MFQAESQIHVFRLEPGRGGSGVLTVLRKYRHEEGEKLIEGARVVVKFGMRESLLREVANYQKYVERYVRTHSTQVIGKPVQTRHLAGVAFLFVGSANGRSRSFLETYTDPHVTSGDLAQIVENIFRDSCQLWYLSAKVRWEPENSTHLDLLQSYKQQLSLEKVTDWQELHFFMDCILHEPADYPVQFVHENEKQLGITLGNNKLLLPNPVLFAENHADLFPQPRFWCLTHGDLNGRNIFVDDNNAAWLIDFFRTGWGPALRDAAELEAVVKFELLQTANLEHLILLEECLLTSPSLVSSLILPAPLNANAEIARAVSTIEAIRREAASINEDDDPAEYRAHLFFYALKMISWQGFSQVDQNRYPIRQRHALYSATKIAALMAEKVV
ncbi:MAG: phosphotransferase [Chloroflexota bacterium]